MNIEFDERKAAANLKKHGVTFTEASTVLFDAMALSREDGDAEGEARFVLVGISNAGRVLTVCYTLRSEAIRLISARTATNNERKQYES